MNIYNKSLFNDLNLLYIYQNDLNNDLYYNSFKDSFKNVFTYNNLDEALENYDSEKIDIIISDIDDETFDFIKKIKEIDIYQSIIILSEKLDSDYMMKAFDLYVDNYIPKTLPLEEIYSKIKLVTKKWKLRKVNLKKRYVLQNILDNQSGITIVTDFKSIAYASKSFLNFYNFKNLNEFNSLYDNLLNIFAVNENYLDGTTKEEFLKNYKDAKAIKKVVLLLNKNLQPKAFHINIDEIKDDSNSKKFYILSLTNISILQEENLQISHKAYVDGLTGVYNRNKFEEIFEYEFSKFKRDNLFFCIAILDIDYFKKFNDTYGHIIGDEVLMQIAQTVNNKIRAIDTFARWGGEEFVLIMPSTNKDGARTLCENLRESIKQVKHPTAGSVTCSFGLTQIQKDDSLLTIFKRCDKALYHAKANGRDRVEVE